MDSANGAETPQPTSPAENHHATFSSDSSTVCASEYEKKDIESQTVRPLGRSISRYFGLPSPVNDTLDEIAEEDLAESDSGEQADVKSPDYQRIDDHPMGYPRMAAFMNSDSNFCLARQYGCLHNRVMLYRQDELRELETELFEMDKRVLQNDPIQLSCRTREDRLSPERRNLINRIDEKLREYHDIVQRTRSFATLQRATRRNYNSVRNWVDGETPFVHDEAATFHKDRDFVAIVDPKEGSWFDSLVEDALSKFDSRLTRRLFITKRDRATTENKLVRLHSTERIDIFSRLIITFLAVVLLMAPVVALFWLKGNGRVKILIIILFTLAFSAALSLFTKARRPEVFAATCAYCAVLVVFLGNVNN